MLNIKLKQKFLKAAEMAWLNNDLSASTNMIRKRLGQANSFVAELSFDKALLPKALDIEGIKYNDVILPSYLVKFSPGLAIFDIGVPLLLNGGFYSRCFSHLKYPERYLHLFSEASGRVLETAAIGHAIVDAYVVITRPPYYHWLLDTIPHLSGAAMLGHIENVKVLGPADTPLKPWQQRLLEIACAHFQIHNLQWLPLTGSVVKIDPGYSQTQLSLGQRIKILNNFVPPRSVRKPWRLIYARRAAGDARQLINEEEVIQALGEKFEIVEPSELPLEKQFLLFSEAKFVVGIHGSNLTNIVFCKQGTVVLEISAGLPQNHFKRISEEAGFNFHRVKAVPMDYEEENIKNNGRETWAQSRADLSLDVRMLRRKLDVLLS